MQNKERELNVLHVLPNDRNFLLLYISVERLLFYGDNITLIMIWRKRVLRVFDAAQDFDGEPVDKMDNVFYLKSAYFIRRYKCPTKNTLK